MSPEKVTNKQTMPKFCPRGVFSKNQSIRKTFTLFVANKKSYPTSQKKGGKRKRKRKKEENTKIGRTIFQVNVTKPRINKLCISA